MEIVSFCSVSTGFTLLRFLLRRNIAFETIIGLNPEKLFNAEKVSGLVDINNFCTQNRTKYAYVNDYSLASYQPEKLFKKPDVILIAAWQRLMPDVFLKYPKLATIGMHGSCDGIVKGRGRSPQNWALIMGKKTFNVSLFKINSAIDAGEIIATESYPLENNDTILNSYIKAGLKSGMMMEKIYNNPDCLNFSMAQEGSPEYFPKRTVDDGAIDWSMSAEDIVNQVRALSFPYPNARTKLRNQEFKVERASIIHEKSLGKNGEIVDVTEDGMLLVSAGKENVLIESYLCSSSDELNIEPGLIFTSSDMEKIVAQIIVRFKKEFKDKKINRSLIEFWNSRDLLKVGEL